ncbi:MAG: rod shape-determining protein [Fimbriimonadaceae bacterium]
MKLVPEIGIDLGTANVLVYRRGKGIVLMEPTVVAQNVKTGELLAIGNEAREMLGKTPGNIVAKRPLRDGVIADYTTTRHLLRRILEKVCGRRLIGFRPRVLVCVPSGVTNVERRAVLQASRDAGASEAMTIEEPMAAAIGAGLPIASASGNMVVDIGGGTTDIAVISLGGLVVSESIRVGGDKFDEAIARHMKNAHGLLVGDNTAEQIKFRIASAYPLEEEVITDVRGRDLVSGLPRTVQVTSTEVRQALSEPINQITKKLHNVLENTPPELSADVIETGITLTGGGALLRGLDLLLEEVTDIPVRVADNALDCVALGTGRALEDFDAIKRTGAVSTI